MSDTKSIGKATPVKWSMPHDSEAWPDTGQVMNAQEAAVAFNTLVDRLTQVDKLARELAVSLMKRTKVYDRGMGRETFQIDGQDLRDCCEMARQLLKLFEGGESRSPDGGHEEAKGR